MTDASHRSGLTDDIYEKLVNDEDARACKSIPESACREVPGNFLKTLLSMFFSKLGDALVNPKITLPWLMQSVGAPAWMLGWLVPIRESGSMLPQLAIASVVRTMAIRKWMWVLGSALQALAVLGIAAVAFSLEGAVAGWAMLAATIGSGVMRVLPVKPEKRWIDVLGALFIGWALISYFAMDLDASAFLYEAAFGAVAGAIGFFWTQLGSVRRKRLEREAQDAQSAIDPNDTKRISTDALAKMFFPEMILDIPFAQRTAREKAFAAAVQYGHADTTGLTRFADPRSPVAPNHGGGMSVNAGGFNVASDGTTTTQLMDGVSFDNKKNWNVRVAFGVRSLPPPFLPVAFALALAFALAFGFGFGFAFALAAAASALRQTCAQSK